MAIVTLPNGGTYNNTKDFVNQDNELFYEFVDEIQSSVTSSTVSEQTCNPNMDRPLKQTWTQTEYTGSNYIVEILSNYIYGPGDIRAFALQSSEITFEIKDK